MRGWLFFEKKDFQAAPLKLATAAANENYLHSERAAWLAALAILSQGEAARSRAILQAISTDAGHPFAAKAKALLEKLDKAERQG